MRVMAWIAIGFGVAAQLFYDLSPLLLPSMASAEGVALYPSAAESLVGLSYRCFPYAVFGVSLVLVERLSAKWSFGIQLGVVMAVLSPPILMTLASATQIPPSHFRAAFWPIRPAVQIAVFLIVASLSQFVRSNQVSRHSAVEG
jgi:hypothetical protein